MRFLQTMGAVAAAALIVASQASAVSWSPQNTVVHGHGNLTLTSGSATVSCTVDLNMKASGAAATTTTSGGVGAGPTFSNCTNNLGISPTQVTASAAWIFTATSSTSADWTFGSVVINIGSGACVITANHTVITSNTWSNVLHTLTVNSATAFAIARSGFCLGTTATAVWSGSLVFASTLVIIP